MIARYLSLALIGLLGTGCASSKLTSFTDPDFRGRVYRSVLIAAHSPHLDDRVDIEERFVKEFEDCACTCRRSVDVLLPTRQYADAELFEIFERHGFDAVLSIQQTDYYEEEEYVPRSYTTQTYGNLNASTFYAGPSAYTHGNVYGRSYTQEHGGYVRRLPRVRHEIILYDVQSRRPAWIGGAFTQGDHRARSKHLIKALAKETVEALQEHGLVSEHVESQPAE
jgi:hypothetical protein